MEPTVQTRRVPRIHPIDDITISLKHKEAVEALMISGYFPNIVRTLLNTPLAFAAIGASVKHFSKDQTEVSNRQKEILILRTTYLCQSSYAFCHHIKPALQSGLTTQQIASIASRGCTGWSSVETALLRACDDIVDNQSIHEINWRSLLSHMNYTAAMYATYIATQYVQVSTLLRAFNVQLEWVVPDGFDVSEEYVEAAMEPDGSPVRE